MASIFFFSEHLSSSELNEVTSPFSVQNFVVKADDLEQIEELGRGAYGVVDKMKHVPSGIIMAVKVGSRHCSGSLIGHLFIPAQLLK